MFSVSGFFPGASITFLVFCLSTLGTRSTCCQPGQGERGKCPPDLHLTSRAPWQCLATPSVGVKGTLTYFGSERKTRPLLRELCVSTKDCFCLPVGGKQRGNRVKQLYSRVPDLVIYIPEFKDLLPMSPTKESVLCPEKYIFGAVLIHF